MAPHSSSRLTLLSGVVVCLLLASGLSWVSGNLNSRFQHRPETIENQNIIFRGQAATSYLVEGQVHGASDNYYYGIVQNRILFPFMLVESTNLLDGRLSESQVYLALTGILTFVGLLAFCLAAMRMCALSLSSVLLAMLCLSIQMLTRFNDGWEHPTDLLDLALTTLMIVCVIRRQRLALIGTVTLMTFNLDSGVFASVLWFFIHAVSKWRVSAKELGFSALLGVLQIAVSIGLRFVLGGPLALVHSRLLELQTAPGTILDALNHLGPDPLWSWPVLLATAYVIPGLWMLDNRRHADAVTQRLVLASLAIGLITSLTGIISELRDFATSMTTLAFAAVWLRARAEAAQSAPLSGTALRA